MFKQLTLAGGLFALLSVPAFAACEENASLEPTVVEVVEFRLASDATSSQFVMAAADLEAAFLCDAPGFVRRTLTQRPDGIWLDMVEWTTLDEALAAADAILVEPSAATFMQAIDPDSIKMNHWNIERKTN